MCGAAVRRGSLVVLVLYLGLGSAPCAARVYTNHWALRIAGGPAAADRIAEKYGYRNMGQVSPWSPGLTCCPPGGSPVDPPLVGPPSPPLGLRSTLH